MGLGEILVIMIKNLLQANLLIQSSQFEFFMHAGIDIFIRLMFKKFSASEPWPEDVILYQQYQCKFV